MKRLWFGEQDISQKRFKKFLKQAGHPTRNGTACKSEVTIYHKLYFLSIEQRHLEWTTRYCKEHATSLEDTKKGMTQKKHQKQYVVRGYKSKVTAS